jgi:hypothetical protein
LYFSPEFGRISGAPRRKPGYPLQQKRLRVFVPLLSLARLAKAAFFADSAAIFL